jgi:hypothetical protein
LRVDVDADATNQDKNMHMYGDVKNKEGWENRERRWRYVDG